MLNILFILSSHVNFLPTTNNRQPLKERKTRAMEFLEGITQRRVKTTRLEVAYLEAGEGNAPTVVLVHGNVSCSWFFEETMLVLVGSGYHVYAPDMRGYGDSEGLPLDATRGVKDFSDDLYSFVEALQIPKFHLFGWSLGGNIVMEYTIAHPETVSSLVLQAAGSPYGFGGTQGPDGTPNYPDFAGAGGGLVNPEFLQRLKDNDRSTDAPNSPRNVLNSFYFKPPFKAAPEREEVFVSAMLNIKKGDENYPGDFVASPNWPGLAAGTKGDNNSLSPAYINQAGLADISPKPAILWLRGDSDQIVADASLFDMGTLGQLGAVPGWPGAEIFPPQPMVTQLRTLLDKYQGNGGSYTEEILVDCGHSPHIEKAEEVNKLLLEFFGSH